MNFLIKRKEKKNRVLNRAILLAACLMVMLFPDMALAKSSVTITTTDAILAIGNSLDLQDITSVTSGYDGTLTYEITYSQYAGAAELKGSRIYVYKSGRITVKVTAPETAKYSSATENINISVQGNALNLQVYDAAASLATGTVELKNYLTLPSDYSGTLSFSSSDRTVATISGSRATLIAPGTTKITVTANSSDKYTAARKTFSLTVTAATPVITVKTISVTADAGSVNLGSYVSAGDYPGTLSYAVTGGTSYARVSGSTLTILGAGTVTIKVTAPATGGYSSAEQSFSITISPAAALTGFKDTSVYAGDTINLSSLITKNSTYTGSVTYTVVSGGGTISGTTLTATSAGTIRVRAQTAATAVYAASSLTADITVSRRPTTLTASSITKYKDDASVTVSSLISITSGYDGTITTSISGGSISISGGRINYTGLGTSTVTVTAPRTDKYEGATATFTVNVRRHATALTATAASMNRFRDDAPMTLSSLISLTPGYDGTVTASVSGSSVSVSGGMVRYTGTGASTVTVTAPATDLYERAETSFTITVQRHITTMTADSITRYMDDASVSLSSLIHVTTGYDGTVTARISGSSVSLSGGTFSYKEAGTSTVRVTAPPTDNYEGSSAEFTITVLKHQTELTARDVTLTQTSPTVRLSDYYTARGGEVTYRIMTGDDVISINGSTVRAEKVGTAQIRLSIAETTAYSGSSATIKVTVTGEETRLTNKGDIRTEYGSPAIALSDRITLSSGYDGELEVKVDGDAVFYRNGSLIPDLAGQARVTVTAPSTKWHEGASTSFMVYVAGKSPELSVKTTEMTIKYGPDIFDTEDLYVTADSYDGTVTASVSRGRNVIEIRQGKIYMTGAGTAEVTFTAGATRGYLSEEKTIRFDILPISPELKTSTVIALCKGAAVDLTEAVSYAKDSAQKPVFAIEEGSDIASLSGSRLTVQRSGVVSVQVTLPAAGPYDKETGIIQVTVVEIVFEEKIKKGGCYNEPCTAIIRIIGDYFDKEDYPDRILTSKGGSPETGEWKKEGDVSSLPIRFETDGIYTFHSANSNKTELMSFEIDMTDPVVSVSYSGEAQHEKYYKSDLTALIRIKDAHPKEAKPVLVTVKDKKTSETELKVSWKEDDTGIYAEVTLGKEGVCYLRLTAEDAAGNKATEYISEEVVLDFTRPDIRINGITDDGVYQSEIVTVITYRDENAGSSTADILLSGARHGETSLSGDVDRDGTGGTVSCTISAGTREEDDAYTLTAVFTDMAGNEARAKATFSINCFGSDFTVDETMSQFLKEFYHSKPADILVTEANVDAIVSREILIGINGNIKALTEDEDYTITETNDSGWKKMAYTISADAFTEEGVYEVIIRTEDRSGNRQDNNIKGLPVMFAIDRTDPYCTLSELEEDVTNNTGRRLSVLVSDNMAPDKLEIYNNEEQIAVYNAEEIDANRGEFIIALSESNDYQNIMAVAYDGAGNRTESQTIRLLITSNPWTKFYRNTPLFFGTISIFMTGTGLTVFLLIRKKRTGQTAEKKAPKSQ